MMLLEQFEEEIQSVKVEIDDLVKRLRMLDQTRSNLMSMLVKKQGVLEWLESKKAEGQKGPPMKPEG